MVPLRPAMGDLTTFDEHVSYADRGEEMEDGEQPESDSDRVGEEVERADGLSSLVAFPCSLSDLEVALPDPQASGAFDIV